MTSPLDLRRRAGRRARRGPPARGARRALVAGRWHRPRRLRRRPHPGRGVRGLQADICGPSGPGGRHPLPEPDDLQTALRRVGIDDGDDIVVVDAGDLLPAARTWWTLRWAGVSSVRVLDGGMDAWTGVVTTEVATPDAGRSRCGPARSRSSTRSCRRARRRRPTRRRPGRGALSRRDRVDRPRRRARPRRAERPRPGDRRRADHRTGRGPRRCSPASTTRPRTAAPASPRRAWPSPAPPRASTSISTSARGAAGSPIRRDRSRRRPPSDQRKEQ